MIEAIYQVAEWGKRFEGAKSRTYENKTSCQMPTKHGLGYRRIVRSQDGAAMFGAWCALIQVLSRHPKPRAGYCTHDGTPDGRAYTAADMELLTDIPEAIFARLIEVASSPDVGWLIPIPRDRKDTTGTPQGYYADTTGTPQGYVHSDLDLDLDSDLDSRADARTREAHQPDNKSDAKTRKPSQVATTWPTDADDFRAKAQAANDRREAGERLTIDDVEAFCAYWLEPSKTGRHRYAMQGTWDTGRRLATWMRHKRERTAGRGQSNITSYREAGYKMY